MAKTKRFKKRAKFSTDEVYYDLFDGGDLRPEDILRDPEDALRVRAAVIVVRTFLEDAEEEGAIEYR